MANFHGHKMTRVGQNLMAKLFSTGRPLIYSSVKVGDGILGSRLISELTGLIGPKLSFDIAATPTRSGDGRWNVTAIFTNAGVTEDFRWREWGVFARDPDTTQEVLMAYANAGDTADYIHTWAGNNDSTYIEERITCACVVTSELEVTAIIDPSQLFASQEELEAHTDNQDNPHGVKANQVKMTGYTKPTELAPITGSDTVRSAVGKLEAGVETAIPTALTVTLPADSWQPITEDIQALTDPALMVMQTLAIPGLTPTTQVRITNVPVVYVVDGHPPLWADNIDNTGYILATETPTVDVTVTLLVQEVTLL